MIAAASMGELDFWNSRQGKRKRKTSIKSMCCEISIGKDPRIQVNVL
jgi:hypothetical protein